MRVRTAVLAMMSVTACGGCNAADDGEAPESLCLWSEPHRLFPDGEVGGEVSQYGRVDEVRRVLPAGPGDLYFTGAGAVFVSGPCGEDLRDVTDALPSDGLLHIDHELALRCDDGGVYRRGADGALVRVFEGIDCDTWFEADAGYFAASPGGDGTGTLVRLLVPDAPELPVAALHDEAVVLSPNSLSTGGFVGPRDVVSVAQTRNRFATGHWSSPFVVLTPGGRVLRVDPRGGPAATLAEGVAEVVPSPDGAAFAYRPRLPDGTGGDLYVRASAAGEAHLVAAADELTPLSRTWWSVDGAWLAVSVGPADRLVEVASGRSWTTEAGASVQRELPGGSLWLTAREDEVVHERAWAPLSGATVALWSHAPLPPGSAQAAADGLELLVPGDGRRDVGWWGEGDLIVVPYDGSSALRLSQRVSPLYTRLADGRIVTPRAPATDGVWPSVADLVLIDPATGEEETLDTSVALGVWSPLQPEGGATFQRVIGDLLTYMVKDPSGARSGVWAINVTAR